MTDHWTIQQVYIVEGKRLLVSRNAIPVIQYSTTFQDTYKALDYIMNNGTCGDTVEIFGAEEVTIS